MNCYLCEKKIEIGDSFYTISCNTLVGIGDNDIPQIDVSETPYYFCEDCFGEFIEDCITNIEDKDFYFGDDDEWLEDLYYDEDDDEEDEEEIISLFSDMENENNEEGDKNNSN